MPIILLALLACFKSCQVPGMELPSSHIHGPRLPIRGSILRRLTLFLARMAISGDNGHANPPAFMADVFLSAEEASRKMLAVSLFNARGYKREEDVSPNTHESTFLQKPTIG